MKNPLAVLYADPDVEYIADMLPQAEFLRLITQKRPDAVKYLPYPIRIYSLDRGDGSNEYLKNANIIGVDLDCGELHLHVFKGYKPDAESLLWLMLHEFRHRMQVKSKVIGSNVRNASFKKWYKWMEKNWADSETIEHVLHEVMPYEIDANMFACELMEIPYRKSKFEITAARLKKLGK